MALNLVKLCVGAQSIADLQSWILAREKEAVQKGGVCEHVHVTRMFPKRKDELLDGGSLYWVIKGQISARQKLMDLRPFIDSQGVSRCRLLLDRALISVTPRKMRAFQGWRYLASKDAPADLSLGAESASQLPEPLRRELSELGLL